jgi:hypothetical protein
MTFTADDLVLAYVIGSFSGVAFWFFIKLLLDVERGRED